MTKQTEALRMAIEALDTLMIEKGSIYQEAIQACKEALAETQEPVDVARVQEDGSVEWNPNLPDLPVGTKLYTTPSREWQSLSDDEIYEIINKSLGRSIGFAVEVTEEKLKAKNNG